MDISNLFDDVKRMNKRQVSTYILGVLGKHIFDFKKRDIIYI